MKKSKILSVFLTVCLVISLVPAMSQPARAAAPTTLIVGGEDVTNGGSGSGWSYDGAGTLTLSGANINGVYAGSGGFYYAIYCEGDLNLVLEDGSPNTVTAAHNDAEWNMALYVTGDLTIGGGGTLTVTGGFNNSENGGSCGIFCTGMLTVTGGTIHSASSATYASYSIYTNSMTVSGGTVYTAGASGANVEASYGILYTGTMTVSGGAIHAFAGSANYLCSGIFCSEGEPMLLSGGYVRAECETADEFNAALGCRITNTATNGAAATVFGADGITSIAAGETVGDYVLGISQSGSAPIVLYVNVPTNVYVDGVNALETMSGDGWSYNGNGVLTLDGANIDGIHHNGNDIRAAIYSADDLTIVLTNNTVNTVTAEYADADNITAIYVWGHLTIRGGGTLRSTAGEATNASTGIYVSGLLTVSNGTVIATGEGGAGMGSIGIYCDGGMELSGGTVTAVGGDGAASMSMGVVYSEYMTVSGGSLTAVGGVSTTGMSAAIGNVYGAAGSVTVSGGTLELSYDTSAAIGVACGAITNNGTKTLYLTGAQIDGVALESVAVGDTTAGDISASGSDPVRISYTPLYGEPEPDPDEPADPTDPMRGNVYGQYVAGGEIDVISVDVTWGSMRFAYSSEAVQIWIPEEHDYSGEPATGWTPLDKNGDLLTITNHSNVDVEIGISTAIEKNTVTAINFVVEETGIADYEGDYVLQRGQEGGYDTADYLMLAAEPQGTLSGSDTDIDKLADITITIAKHE